MAVGVTKMNFLDGEGSRDLNPLSTAPVFVATNSYAVGDYCYHDGTLYKCTTAHTGVWSASHFTAVTIGTELKAQNAELDAEIADVKSDLSVLNLGDNYLYPLYDNFERITSNTSGEWVASTNRIACRTILYTDKQIFLTADTGYKWAFNVFDAQGNYTTTSGWKSGTFVISPNTYFCVLLCKSDDSVILPNESTHLYMSIIQNGIRELKQTALTYGTSGGGTIEPTFENNGTTLIVTLPTRMFILGYDFSIYTKDFSETQTISVAHNYVLYYDFADKTLKTIIYSNMKTIYSDVFVLMYNNNGRPVGELARYYKRVTTDTTKPILSTSVLIDSTAIGVSNASAVSETINVIIPNRCFLIGYTKTIDAIDKSGTTHFDVPHNSVVYFDLVNQSYNLATYSQYSAVTNDKVLLLYNNHGQAYGQWAKYQESICSADNFKTTIFCSRQGDIDDCPENSLIGLKRAKTFGYNRVRVSVSFTSDNVPVCFHDDYLGARGIVYDENGEVVTDVTTPITSYTYAQLQNYDFGLYKGEAYRNTKIATLSDVITLMRNLGCGLDIEMKLGWTAETTEIAYNMVALAGMIPHTTFIGSNIANLQTIIAINEYATVSFATTVSEERIDMAATLQTGKNEVWIALLHTDYSNLTDALRLRAINKGLKFKYCSVYSTSSISADVMQCEMVEVAYMKYPTYYVMKGN